MNRSSRRALVMLGAALIVLAVVFGLTRIDPVRQLVGLEIPDAFDGKLRETSEAFNARLPIMINKDTRLDSTAAVGDEFHYNYTLVTQQIAEVSPEQLTASLRPSLVTSLCSSDEMRSFMAPGVEVVYNYAASDGAHIVSIRIDLDACPS